MALQISGTNVIDNSRNLVNIASFDSTVTSIWDSVTTTAVGKTLVNREYCTATANNIILILPSSPSAGNQCAVSVTTATGVTVFAPVIQGYGPDIFFPDGTYLALDVPNATVTFTYVDATRGWMIS